MRDGSDQKTGYWQVVRLVHRAWRYRLGRDKQEISTLLNHLKPGQCAVDIGAHKGAYTYWMQRAVGREGSVVAFEPQPLLAQRLTGLMKKMAISHVTIEQMGLSDQAAMGELHIPGDGSPSPGASLVGQSITGPQTTVSQVKLETLDGYFANRGRVHLIKCDVEGHELAVFKSGIKLLKRDRPLILFECESRHQSGHTVADVFQFLVELGYQGRFYDRGESYPISAFRAEMQANPGSRAYVNNFIFTHPATPE
ncbi:MAG: FkbM family methyltransferase [Magnetococcales bacterium]|nr:FkbM family methyltransferase [Magnetococcales bacterium]